MQIFEPVCEKCKHIDNSKPGYFCKAFPDGIPKVIIEEGNTHKIPLPDQKNDIVFEQE
jgi:hypothetical protein